MGNNPSSYRIRDVAGKVGRDCRCHAWQVALAGRTLIGERVWDLMRLIDWSRYPRWPKAACSCSAIPAAACDERIDVAVPCCAFNDYISPRGTRNALRNRPRGSSARAASRKRCIDAP